MICSEYAKTLGMKASEDLTKSLFDNPYPRGSKNYDLWIIGFLQDDKFDSNQDEEDEILIDEF